MIVRGYEDEICVLFCSQRVKALISSRWGSTELVCCFCCLMSPVNNRVQIRCRRLPLALPRAWHAFGTLGKLHQQSFDSTSQGHGGFAASSLTISPRPDLRLCVLGPSNLMLELSLSSVALLVGLTFLTWYLIMPAFFSRPIDFTGKVSLNTIQTYSSQRAGRIIS